MSREYLGGAVAFRSTDLTGVNMTGSRYPITWESTNFDLGGPESVSGFWNSSDPTKFIVPTYIDNRKLVVILGFGIAWTNVAIGTDWCTYAVAQNGVEIGTWLHPGGFEVINPVLDFHTKQVMAKQGDEFIAQCQWRSTETSVNVIANSSTYFEILVLGYIY